MCYPLPSQVPPSFVRCPQSARESLWQETCGVRAGVSGRPHRKQGGGITDILPGYGIVGPTAPSGSQGDSPPGQPQRGGTEMSFSF